MGEFTSFKFLHTTEVAVQKSASDIMGILGQMGATNVSMEMENLAPSGMTFAVQMGEGMVCYRLPVRYQPIYALMIGEHKKNRRSRYSTSYSASAKAEIEQKVMEQAKRTAWRIALEWLKVQCAFVSHGIKTAQEVFLSDQLVRRDGQVLTVGEIMLSHNGVALLTGGAP